MSGWAQANEDACVNLIKQYEELSLDLNMSYNTAQMKSNIAVWRKQYEIISMAILDDIVLAEKTRYMLYSLVSDVDDFNKYGKTEEEILAFQKMLRAKMEERIKVVSKLSDGQIIDEIEAEEEDLDEIYNNLIELGCQDVLKKTIGMTTSISGYWKAGDMEYLINQNGSTFSWDRKDVEETAEGKFTGPNQIQANWNNKFGKGGATGNVIVEDDVAIRIEWSNGIHFIRSEKPSESFSIEGDWYVGPVKYVLSQIGSTFTWDRKDEKATGKFTGKNKIEASWTNNAGKGSALGTVVGQNGRAIRIDWNNGITFYRR